MRRLFLISFLILIAGLTVLGYLFLKKSKKPELLVMDIVPVDIEVLLECDNINQLTQKVTKNNLVINELLKNQIIQSFINDISFLDTIAANTDCQEYLAENHIYFAYDTSALGSNCLLAFNLKSIKHSETIKKFLQKNINSFNFFKSGKINQELISVKFAQNKPNAYIYNKAGLFILSNSLSYLEKVIADQKKNTLSSITLFNSLQESENSNTDFRLFVKNSFYPQLIYSNAIKNNFPATLKTWTSMDVTLSSNELKWNGFAEHDGSFFLNALLTQQPVQASLLNYCPANCSYFYFLGTSDYAKFNQSVFSANRTPELKTSLSELSKFSDADFYTEWNKLTNGELLVVGNNSLSTSSKIAVAGFENKNKAHEFIKQFSDSCSVLNESFTDSLYRLVHPKLFNVLCSGVFEMNTEYVYVHDNNLIFAESSSVISNYLNNLKSSGNINSNTSFTAAQKMGLSNECNFYYYQNFKSNASEFLSVLNTQLANQLPELNNASLSGFGLQLSTLKNKVFIQGILNTSALKKEEPTVQATNATWQINLDTLSSSVPEIVINHKTQEKEIILSDDKGNVYLVDANGNQLWKVNVNGKVLSKIYQVDFYKNDKLQYLFNTENEIHLIDRKGEYLEGFPAKLDAPATNALAVFDYENDKNYRILIACANNKIYNYNIEGKKQAGFDPVKLEVGLSKPIQFVRIDGKDFIIAIEKNGKVNCLDRKGKIRIPFTKSMQAAFQEFAIQDNNTPEASFFSYYDAKNNSVNQLLWNDKVVAKQVNPSTIAKQVEFVNINDDNKKDVVILTTNGFDVYDENGNYISGYQNKTKDQIAIKTFSFKNEMYFMLHLSNYTIKIIDANMKELNVPKMYFSKMPEIKTISSDNKLNVIGTFKNQLMCYELNLN
jgi:hypothetical protein